MIILANSWIAHHEYHHLVVFSRSNLAQQITKEKKEETMFKKLAFLLAMAFLAMGILPSSASAQELDETIDPEIRALVESFLIEGEEIHAVNYIMRGISDILEQVGATEWVVEGNTMTIQAIHWMKPGGEHTFGCGGGLLGIFMTDVAPCITDQEFEQGGEKIFTSANYRNGTFNIVVIPPVDSPVSNMLSWREITEDSIPQGIMEVVDEGCLSNPQFYQNLTRTFVVCGFRLSTEQLQPFGEVLHDNENDIHQAYKSVVDAEGNYLYTLFLNAESEDGVYYFGSPDRSNEVEASLAEMLGTLALPNMTDVIFNTNEIRDAAKAVLEVSTVEFIPSLHVFYSGEKSFFPSGTVVQGGPWASSSMTFSLFDMWDDESDLYISNICQDIDANGIEGTICTGIPLGDYDWVETFPSPLCEDEEDALLIISGEYRYPYCKMWVPFGFQTLPFPETATEN